jgi:hypothetical protein
LEIAVMPCFKSWMKACMKPGMRENIGLTYAPSDPGAGSLGAWGRGMVRSRAEVFRFPACNVVDLEFASPQALELT